MPLAPQTIEAQIGALLDSTANLELATAKSEFKSQLTQIIVAAIESATVTIPIGAVIVLTSGSATTQTGVNTAPALGSLT